MSLATDVDYLEARASALADLRDARRANRVESIDWFEAFYKAYVGVVLVAVGLYLGAGWLGDQPLSDAQFDRLLRVGPHYAGVLVAVVVGLGLRSAGRGGPLAFELADIRHVLLSPVDRHDSIRSSALRSVGHAVFIGGSTGAATGLIASRRLPEAFEWVVSGAVFGGVVALLGHGVALGVVGLRVRAVWCDVIAAVLICWSVTEALLTTAISPFGLVGHIATWPGDNDYTAFVGIAVSVVAAFLGLRLVLGLSLEAAERRSSLVGQLRFAATTQDIRTVMLIQRQLSQQQLRATPWFGLPRGRQRGNRRGVPVARIGVFARRSIGSFLRWPLLRLLRLLALLAIATLGLVGVWAGTTPLFVVSGLALWIVALDLLEPLAQEADRPDRAAGAPAITGLVHLRLLVVPVVSMLLLVGLCAVPLVWSGPGEVTSLLVPNIVSITGLAVGGAALVVIRRPGIGGSGDLIPEVAGVKLLWQLVIPPGLSVFGFLPIALARNEWFSSRDIDQVASAINLTSAAGLAFATWCFIWVRYAEQIRFAVASAARPAPTPEEKS